MNLEDIKKMRNGETGKYFLKPAKDSIDWLIAHVESLEKENHKLKVKLGIDFMKWF